MLDPSQVSACLVTRGDQPEQMARILDSLLPYGEVIVWDNSIEDDHLTHGRYVAMLRRASNEVCYTQDDDVIVPEATQRALLAAYEPGMTIAIRSPPNPHFGGSSTVSASAAATTAS